MKPIVRLCSMLILCLLSVASLTARDVVVLDRRIVPASLRVGDPAELRIRLITPADAEFQIPATLPETQWVEVSSVRIIDRDNETEVVIGFSAYRTGIVNLPEIDLDAVRLQTGQARVESVLPDDGVATVMPVRGPLFAPGSQVLLLVILVLVTVAPFALYRGLVHTARHVHLTITSWKENQPYRRILRVLRTIHTRFDALEPKSFYISLIDEARLYLSGRLGVDVVSATASEIPLVIRGKIEDVERARQLESMFRQADLVKFAGASSDKDKRFRHLIVFAEIVASIEKKPPHKVAHRSQRPLRRNLVRLAGEEPNAGLEDSSGPLIVPARAGEAPDVER